MFRNPFTLRMTLVVVVVFAVLCFPWPRLAHAYVAFFSTAWTVVLNISTDAARIGFELRPESGRARSLHERWRAAAVVRSDHGKREVNTVDVRRLSYLPTALYLSLVAAVASRIKDKRTIVNSAFGLLLLQCLPALLMIILLQQAGWVDIGRGAETALMISYRGLISAPGMTYAIPAIVWLIVHRRILWREDASTGSGGRRRHMHSVTKGIIPQVR